MKFPLKEAEFIRFRVIISSGMCKLKAVYFEGLLLHTHTICFAGISVKLFIGLRRIMRWQALCEKNPWGAISRGVRFLVVEAGKGGYDFLCWPIVEIKKVSDPFNFSPRLR